MARRGGYGRDVEGIEWAKMSAHQDAEGKLSAAAMGQSYYTWLNDAVAFHVYYCERYRLHQQYSHDQAEASRSNTFTVDPHDPRYQPQRPRPVITMQPGQGSAARMQPGPTR